MGIVSAFVVEKARLEVTFLRAAAPRTALRNRGLANMDRVIDMKATQVEESRDEKEIPLALKAQMEEIYQKY